MKTAVVEKHINNCFIILNRDKRKATFRRKPIIKKIKESLKVNEDLLISANKIDQKNG